MIVKGVMVIELLFQYKRKIGLNVLIVSKGKINMKAKKLVCKKHHCVNYHFTKPECPYCSGLFKYKNKKSEDKA